MPTQLNAFKYIFVGYIGWEVRRFQYGTTNVSHFHSEWAKVVSISVIRFSSSNTFLLSDSIFSRLFSQLKFLSWSPFSLPFLLNIEISFNVELLHFLLIALVQRSIRRISHFLLLTLRPPSLPLSGSLSTFSAFTAQMHFVRFHSQYIYLFICTSSNEPNASRFPSRHILLEALFA